jgi:hypothetical protein
MIASLITSEDLLQLFVLGFRYVVVGVSLFLLAFFTRRLGQLLALRLWGAIKVNEIVQLYGEEYKLVKIGFRGASFEGTEEDWLKIIPLGTWAATEKKVKIIHPEVSRTRTRPSA